MSAIRFISDMIRGLSALKASRHSATSTMIFAASQRSFHSPRIHYSLPFTLAESLDSPHRLSAHCEDNTECSHTGWMRLRAAKFCRSAISLFSMIDYFGDEIFRNAKLVSRHIAKEKRVTHGTSSLHATTTGPTDSHAIYFRCSIF